MHETKEPENISHSPPKLEAPALDGIAGDIIKKILPHTEASEAAMLFNLLAGFGNIAGRSAYTMAGNSPHHTNLFGVLVGATSSGRKGTSWSAIKELLREVDPDWYQSRMASGLSSGEGLIYHVRDERTEKKPIKDGKRIVDYQDEIVDEGVSDKRIFLLEEEFASVLKRMKGKDNTLSAIIRSLWDGGNLRTLIKNSPDTATEPHGSIMAHITKAEASELVAGVDCQNGLVNRFMWIYTNRSKSLPHAGAIPMEQLSGEIKRLQDAVFKAQTEREIPLSAEAHDRWSKIYDEHCTGQAGLIGAVTGRAAPMIRRLSLCYALMEGNDEQTLGNLESGLSAWKYCEDSAGWLFGTPFNDPDADRLWNTLKGQKNGMTRSEISLKVFNNHADKERINTALEKLERSGEAFKKTEPTIGAPRERWFPNSAANC